MYYLCIGGAPNSIWFSIICKDCRLKHPGIDKEYKSIKLNNSELSILNLLYNIDDIEEFVEYSKSLIMKDNSSFVGNSTLFPSFSGILKNI